MKQTAKGKAKKKAKQSSKTEGSQSSESKSKLATVGGVLKAIPVGIYKFSKNLRHMVVSEADPRFLIQNSRVDLAGDKVGSQYCEGNLL